MKRAYWEKMARTYSEEIFDVLLHDRKGLIRAVIEAHASPRATVMDIGCAIGKWVPVLAPAFKKVVAVDISAENLAIAADRFARYTNVEYRRADMSGSRIRVPRCDFGICINAILTPNAADRRRFFRNLGACVKSGGRIVLSIPSLESWMLTQVIQQEYGLNRAYFPPTRSGPEAIRKWNQIRRAVADIDEVPHKHYMQEELHHLFREVGFIVEDIQKLEYEWNTEFHRPPKKLKGPGPWDWMCVVRKK
ncbi:MAG: hypothetical protein RJA57_286 [Bacteroidota bacterium]|jgi:SAM-dependent methyltransferase